MGKDLKGKELGQGIRQRSNGVYVARFVDRFGIRRELYDKDLNALKRIFLKARYEDSACLNVYDEPPTVDEWFQKWMEIYKKRELRENTYNSYVSCYRTHVSPVIGGMRVSDVRPVHVEELLTRAADRSSGTRAGIKKVVGSMFDKAVVNGFIRVNPAADVKVRSCTSSMGRSLHRWEQDAFLRYTSGTIYHNVFTVALLTGMRAGELFALTEKDLDFDRGVIHVNKTLLRLYDSETHRNFLSFGPPKTPTSTRDIPMIDTCRGALQDQLRLKRIIAEKKSSTPVEGFEDLIFVTKENKPISIATIDGAIKTIVRHVNDMLPDDLQVKTFSMHTFRHTFTTRCFEMGVESKVVQSVLGHSSISMTMDVYTHLSEDFTAEELQKLMKMTL